MSKCIKCGRELNTGETLEIYSGMCGKCYEEQYDKFVKKIDGKYLFGVIEKPLRQQIDQLKQQLAEAEEYIENDEVTKREYYQKTDEIIAEKDKEIEKLKQQNTLLENENGKLAKELIVKNYKKAQKEVSFGIQLTIQELEKLRDKVVESSEKIVDTVECIQDFHSGITLGRFKRIIDQQIKELKGEKDVED